MCANIDFRALHDNDDPDLNILKLFVDTYAQNCTPTLNYFSYVIGGVYSTVIKVLKEKFSQQEVELEAIIKSGEDLTAEVCGIHGLILPLVTLM